MSIQEILESAGLPAQRGVYTGRDKPDAYYTFLRLLGTPAVNADDEEKERREMYRVTEIAGVYDSYVSKTEGLFAQYESQFNERYSSFESTLDNWDKELLSAYTEFMAKIKLFQSDAENEFNTWFESIKDKLGEDIAGSLQLQIEELAAAMQEVKKQAEAGTKETKEAIAALDERLKRVESGWGIDYKHDAVLGLCYMGAAYMSQHYERTVETAALGATYVGNSYLANTF